jgi:hypothetical protein
MAGTKNLFNTDPLEIVREALERANAIPLQHEYVDIALSNLGPTDALVVISPKTVSGQTPYVDAISLSFPKLDMSEKLPKDMCYSGTWPATFADFASFMLTSYDLLILPGQWEIRHGATIYPLDGTVLIDPDLSSDRTLLLSAAQAHPLFTPSVMFPLLVTVD